MDSFLISEIPVPTASGPGSLRVGHARMDDEHDDFLGLVQALLSAPDTELIASLDQLIAHASAHFAQEDTWMCELEFPARKCHMDEHAAVLRSANGVRRRTAAGDLHSARLFARELDSWFAPHVQHLDSALATWICKSNFDARPFVFHPPMRARPISAGA
ncbi:MAG: hemerythrin-like metal-binding protein [Comamonadaceae bacterium]|nr:MAG: hemerythrin-like metal-binding protein [Comamonadaceae bacterium]